VESSPQKTTLDVNRITRHPKAMATACLTSSKSGKNKNKNIHAYKGALKKMTFRKFSQSERDGS